MKNRIIYLIIAAVLVVGVYLFINQPGPQAGVTLYTNDSIGIQFEYPDDWSQVESEDRGSGIVTAFRSQATVDGLANKQVDPGYSYDLIVRYWPDVNNEYARGGTWVGGREYSGLDDLLSDTKGMKQKIGELEAGGELGREVIIGGAGAAYGVIFERDGIYEFAFLTAGEKEQLSEDAAMVLESLRWAE